MLTVLDTQSWDKNLYEGNADFVQLADGTIFIASNVRQDNSFVILRSNPVPPDPGPGSSFTVVATYIFPTLNTSFDPVIVFDPNTGLLHIIGVQNNPINPTLVDLLKFTYDTYYYDTEPLVLSEPVVLATGFRVRLAYDVVVLSPVSAEWTVGIVGCLDQPVSYGNIENPEATPSPGMNLVFFELDPDDTILQINELVNSPIRSGNTFSSVSLISPDGTQVEMYYEAHPKILTFSDQSFTINLLLRNISGQWGSATLLTTFQGRFTDDRLTVVADGTARWISQVYYNVLTHPQGLVGNAVFGYSADASTWIFHTVPGSTAGGSFIQATLSLSPSGANVAYLLEPFDSPATEWPLRVATLDTTLRFIDVPGFYNNLNFTWLRGSKSIIDSGSVWAVVGDAVQPIAPSPLPIWISFFNVPPIAAVVPVNATVYRGAVGYDIGAGFVSGDLVLSAASTLNASQDPLTFTWSENGPAGVTVNPINGVTTTLNVPRSVGGATASFQVELSVFTHLHPVNPPVYSNTTVPFNAAPAITPLSPLAVPRGNLKDPSQLAVIAPTITGMSDIDDLPVYTWAQISGTPMVFLFGANRPTLTFQALGADVSGETLVFQLSANDGVNAPAVQTFEVDVAAYNFASLDTLFLSRSVRSGNIAERHDPTQTWGTLDVSAIVTNLGIVKRSSVLDGSDRYLIISPTSVVVYGGVNPNLHVLRTLLVPINPNTGNPEATILDAVHTEQDCTLVLGSNLTLYRYGAAPLHPTDDPDTEIDLTTLTSMIFNKIFTTSTFGGIRILVLTGPDGVLLLQASTRTLAVQGILGLDQATHYLYGCYDSQTEILTRNHGFVLFKDLMLGEEVATRNTITHGFEWQEPMEYITAPYNGTMCEFKSRSMDLLVTPNHKMLISYHGEDEREILAENFTKSYDPNLKIPVVSNWVGEKVGTQEFYSSCKCHALGIHPGSRIIIDGDDYCALMGAYLSEGNIRKQGGIEINQKESSKGYELYKELIKRINGSAQYNGKAFILPRIAITSHFRKFGHASDKFVPDVVLNAPKRQLRIFWDYFIAGDGCKQKRPSVTKRGDFPREADSLVTTSRRMADQMVEIAQKLGWSASTTIVPAAVTEIKGKIYNCKKKYIVGVRYSKAMSVCPSKVQYHGTVHCVTVPNGFVYVRRNGKPCWCGNSDNVQFIRTNNVESLRSGLLLIGTIAPAIGTITNLQILNNNATFTAANNLRTGNKVLLENLTLVAPDLNGRELLVTTANPVQFTLSVEHANVGTSPYTETGTATALDAGLTYETLVDLAQGQIVGTWDSSKLRNQFVTSGEILFAPESTYSGTPAAPVLNVPTAVGAVVTLSWVEERTDLMEGYTVFYSTNSSPFVRLQTINSGVVEKFSVALTSGQMYQFQIQAFSVDGVSPLSNVGSISI